MNNLCRAKRLDNGEWVEGYYAIIDSFPTIIPQETELDYAGGVTLISGLIYVDPDTVCRCTGLKDIWEKDIVEFTYWWCDGAEQQSILKGEIIYIPESLSFGLRGVKNKDWLRHIGADEFSSDTAPFAFWNFSEADFEVIGNTIDHPALLEKV